ncbi:hypothetical protein BDK51DRAFT_51212, partial [Blyttiomyces helicus]
MGGADRRHRQAVGGGGLRVCGGVGGGHVPDRVGWTLDNASIYIYQFLHRKPYAEDPLSLAATSSPTALDIGDLPRGEHVVGTDQLVRLLRAHGIKPFFVFDGIGGGPRKALKAVELERRAERRVDGVKSLRVKSAEVELIRNIQVDIEKVRKSPFRPEKMLKKKASKDEAKAAKNKKKEQANVSALIDSTSPAPPASGPAHELAPLIVEGSGLEVQASTAVLEVASQPAPPIPASPPQDISTPPEIATVEPEQIETVAVGTKVEDVLEVKIAQVETTGSHAPASIDAEPASVKMGSDESGDIVVLQPCDPEICTLKDGMDAVVEPSAVSDVASVLSEVQAVALGDAPAPQPCFSPASIATELKPAPEPFVDAAEAGDIVAATAEPTVVASAAVEQHPPQLSPAQSAPHNVLLGPTELGTAASTMADPAITLEAVPATVPTDVTIESGIDSKTADPAITLEVVPATVPTDAPIKSGIDSTTTDLAIALEAMPVDPAISEPSATPASAVQTPDEIKEHAPICDEAVVTQVESVAKGKLDVSVAAEPGEMVEAVGAESVKKEASLGVEATPELAEKIQQDAMKMAEDALAVRAEETAIIEGKEACERLEEFFHAKRKTSKGAIAAAHEVVRNILEKRDDEALALASRKIKEIARMSSSAAWDQSRRVGVFITPRILDEVQQYLKLM